jgi:hypothetical protein
MPKSRIYWQFKNTQVTRPDVDQLLGAVIGKLSVDDIEYVFPCKSVSRDAIKRANELYETEGIKITFQITRE